MALLQEVESFISEAELTPEQATQMRAIFEAAPKAQEKVKGGVLRQSDYSKHMNSVKAATDELAAKQTKLDQEFARLAQYGTDADDKVLKAQQAVEAAEAKVVKAQNRARRWAENFGVPENEIKEVFGTTEGAPEPKITPQPTGDDAPMTVAEFKKQAQQFGQQFAMLPAVSQKIMVDHYNLFGKFPEDMEAVVAGAMKSGEKLSDYAAKHYKFDERRSQLAEEKVENRIKEETDKRVNARLSEMKVPTSTRAPLTGSRILGLEKAPAPPATGPATLPAPTRNQKAFSTQNRVNTVQKAVNAFREGKYQQK